MEIMETVVSWIQKTIKEAVDKLVEQRLEEADATLLSKKEVAEMLGMSPSSFDMYYRYAEGFPRELPAKRWSKLAVIEWLKKQS